MIYVTVVPCEIQPGYTKANALLIITSAFAKDSLSLYHFLRGSFFCLCQNLIIKAVEERKEENAGLYEVAPRMVSVRLERYGCAKCMLAERQSLNRTSGSCIIFQSLTSKRRHENTTLLMLHNILDKVKLAKRTRFYSICRRSLSCCVWALHLRSGVCMLESS